MPRPDREPVGVFIAKAAAKCNANASPERRNCVMPILMMASKGKNLFMDEKVLS